MGVFKILSVLAVIALATTVNCQDCQDVCEAECTAFVAEVADECQVSDRNSITDAKCKDHCELVCFGIADGTGDCAKAADDCARGCGAWAKDLADDLGCTADKDMENQVCNTHCNAVCA